MTQEMEKLLEWAKFAVEEERARFGYGSDDPNDIQPPTWLAELEIAINEVEMAQ